MYSGGKDSTFAIDHAMEKGWDIEYLISIKPTRTDCYLFHYATVEHTKELAKILEIPHILEKCEIADPEKEALIVKKIVEKQQKTKPVNAVVLGGTGLQETQLRSIQNALRPMGIEVFASHAGEEHDLIVEKILDHPVGGEHPVHSRVLVEDEAVGRARSTVVMVGLEGAVEVHLRQCLEIV